MTSCTNFNAIKLLRLITCVELSIQFQNTNKITNQYQQNRNQNQINTMTNDGPSPLQELMNEKMAEYVPELDSEYSETPMARARWCKPSETLNDGTPCFVQHAGDLSQVESIPTKRDYIWIPSGVHKDLLAGYYHLRTKEAYREVLRRVLFKDKVRRAEHLSEALKLKCFRSKEQREDDKISRKVVSLIKNRAKCREPNDVYFYSLQYLEKGWNNRSVPQQRATSNVGFAAAACI